MSPSLYPISPMDRHEIQELANRLKAFEAIPRIEISRLVATCHAYFEKFGPLEIEPVPIPDPVLRGETPLFGD